MAASQDRIRAALDRPNPTVTALIRHFAEKDDTAANLDRQPNLEAYLAVYRFVAAHGGGKPEQIVADTARIWDHMPETTRRQIATTPLTANALIAPVAQTDAAVSARMSQQNDQARKPAAGQEQAETGLDAMGRDRWARLIGAAGVSASAGASGYGALATSYDPSKGLAGLNAQNFGTSPFAAAGLDLQMTLRLGAAGFSAQNILAGAANATLFGFGVRDERAVRDFAIIDRHDPRAPEFIAKLQDYQRRLREDEDLKKLEDERRRTQDQSRQRELDREIRQRREVHARESGVPEHIDRTESSEARDAQRRRKEGVEKLQDTNKEIRLQRGIEAGRAVVDEKVSPNITPGVATNTRHVTDKGAVTPAAALAAKF